MLVAQGEAGWLWWLFRWGGKDGGQSGRLAPPLLAPAASVAVVSDGFVKMVAPGDDVVDVSQRRLVKQKPKWSYPDRGLWDGRVERADDKAQAVCWL